LNSAHIQITPILVVPRGQFLAGSIRAQIDIQEHALVCSTLTRLAQRIGIERRARDVTPDPLEYARRYDSEAAE
jgi:hypothetical protein